MHHRCVALFSFCSFMSTGSYTLIELQAIAIYAVKFIFHISNRSGCLLFYCHHIWGFERHNALFIYYVICVIKNVFNVAAMLKKILIGIVPVALLSYGSWLILKTKKDTVSTTVKLQLPDAKDLGEEDEENMKALFVKERLKYEFDMIKDPRTGKIPKGIYKKAQQEAEGIAVKENNERFGLFANNNYIAVGPNNIGGRTRAVEFDKRFGTGGNQVIIAGSVSGGIFRSTDGGANWTRVTPNGELHNVTAIAQDTRAGFENTWYAGGGEALGNSAAAFGAFYYGFGILKSTDNGATWSRLTLTVTDIGGGTLGGGTVENFDNVFDIVHKIVVNPTNGHVYICGHRRLIRSTDGGNSFQVVFNGRSPASADAGQMDLVCDNTGVLYLGVNGGFPNLAQRGLWASASGNAGSWVRFAGGSTGAADSLNGWRANSFNVLNITGTDTSYESRRVVLALAPSNQRILYVTYENGLSQESASGANPELDMFKFDFTANTYTNLSANMPDFSGQFNGIDPITTQGGYNILLAVKPNDPNTVFLGGTNLYRSTDGFNSTANTAWIGGYKWWGAGGTPSIALYESSHPDIHALVFDPTNPNRAICGNDGGVQVTNDIMTNITPTNPVTWTYLTNYQSLQYYHIAIDPSTTQINFAGGAQDNGTVSRRAGLPSPNNHERIGGGDGGATFVDFLGGNQIRVYTSSQLGSLARVSFTTFTNIRPSNSDMTPNPGGGFGEFVTYLKGDFNNPEDLYYVNFNKVFRTTSASTVTQSTGWTFMSGIASAVNPANPNGTNIAIRALELSRGPYNSTHTLYIGTTNGRVFRLNDPRNADPTTAPVNITPSGLTGNISDIAVNPNDDSEVMVTVSNYATISVYHTKNAKAATPVWKNAEGNVSLPSFRSCMIIVKKDASNNSIKEYYIGTSNGLFSATNIDQTLEANGTINWAREGASSLNFSVIQSMDYRPEDNILLIGTHGNGMYYANVGTPDYRPNSTTGVDDPVRNDPNFIQKTYPTITTGNLEYRIGNMFTVRRIILQIHNTAGQLVLRKESGYENGVLDVSRLAKGAYVLTITSSDYKQQFIQRFVKD